MDEGSSRSLYNYQGNKNSSKYVIKKFSKEICIFNEYFNDLETAFKNLSNKASDNIHIGYILCDIEQELILGYKNIYSNRLLISTLKEKVDRAS